MDEPTPKKAAIWLYLIAILLILFVLGIAFLIRFAPKLLFLWSDVKSPAPSPKCDPNAKVTTADQPSVNDGVNIRADFW